MASSPAVASRHLTREACEAIGHRVLDAARDGGTTECTVYSQWNGNIRWVRNRPRTAGDTFQCELRIVRKINGRAGTWLTDRLDDASIAECVRAAEFAAGYNGAAAEGEFPLLGQRSYLAPSPLLWSDTTYDLDAAGRSTAARVLVGPAIDARLLVAGYLEVGARAECVMNSAGLFAYGAATRASCAVTVRNAEGTGSGWAGVAFNDWTRVDAPALAARALEKCRASANPVAVEPGRYTVILEREAVAQLMDPILGVGSQGMLRMEAEKGSGVFAAPGGNSRIGQRVLDERITITSDPLDRDIPGLPFSLGDDLVGEPLHATTWIANGVLMALAYDRRYAVLRLRLGSGLPFQMYRVSGGPTTVDEMIRTTKRGLLVTRFNGVEIVGPSLLCSGTTRDGLWLIENGAITKPVKNLRFTESPLFAFNNVEQLGPPGRVYGLDAVVPPMKVRDFSFTGLSDAV